MVLGFNPNILDIDVMDKVLEVSSEDAINYFCIANEIFILASKGLMVGISRANIVAALRFANLPENKGKLIVVRTIFVKTHNNMKLYM
ncbi:Bifunctional L-3-cyanoalanine synthase/cysteine synthase C1, mitochondrial [Trifolium repens]|nr:O-acetylserine (thiol) lyase (OAS-TL) isoform A1 [Trifolium repens]WJX77338.1 Bifunctional L-3-cyanoalanine synthase/cysteine synthase C1, mitochondrial [Trifolium repens]